MNKFRVALVTASTAALVVAIVVVFELATVVPGWLAPVRQLTVTMVHWARLHWLSAAALSAIATAMTVVAPFIIRSLDSKVNTLADGEAFPGLERAIMLRRIRYKWIDGVLEPSLSRAAYLVLRLDQRSDLLVLPTRRMSRSGVPAGKAAENINIVELFDQVGCALLIVGPPGSGKTTLLLRLCEELLNRAERDQALAIPVVLNLASWHRDQPEFDLWVIDELSRAYQVPRRIATEWIKKGVLTLLLDGLDEVTEAQRGVCVQAINVWRDDHGLIPIAVCCRTAEIESLRRLLKLEEAIEIQSPSEDQINQYLESLESTGTPLADVRLALAGDPSLQELLRSPLFLNVVALAYHGRVAPALVEPGTSAEREGRLWEAYIARMFEQRPLPDDCGYTTDMARGWITWLAKLSYDTEQTEFYLDRLVPEWLPTQVQQARARSAVSLIAGIIAGLTAGFAFSCFKRAYDWKFGVTTALTAGSIVGLICAALAALIIGLSGGLTVNVLSGSRVNWSLKRLKNEIRSALTDRHKNVSGVDDYARTRAAGIFGLSTSLVAWISGTRAAGASLGVFVSISAGLGCGLAWALVGLLAGRAIIRIEPVEQIRWSWRKLRSGSVSLVLGGLSGGVALGVTGALLGNRSSASIGGLAACLTLILAGALTAGLSAALREERAVPNEGIRRSARFAIIVGLSLGLSAGLIFGASTGAVYGSSRGLFAGIGATLAFGAPTALLFGGAACLQHYVVRLWLRHYSIAPWHYGKFLDGMSQRLVLRRSGGAFLFIHRLLRDYLARSDVG